MGTTSLTELEKNLYGRFIYPDDADYAAGVKLWNGRIKAKPSALVQAAGMADVAATVKFARENDLPFTVRAGGHEVDGWTLQDNTLAIDLRAMNGVIVDRRTRRGFVEAGTRLRKLDRETQAHGLGVTAGTVSDTGVAGLTLGGGFGWAQRKFGATVDSLLAVEGVTVDGELIRASAEENADLFWGLRGGGGNFIIATSFEYQLHEFGPDILSGAILYGPEQIPDAFRAWREFMLHAPDEVGSMFVMTRAHPDEFPEELHNKPVGTIVLSHVGSVEQAEKDFAPIRAHGNPIADLIHVGPYADDLQRSFEVAMPNAFPTYQKYGFIRELSDAAIDDAIDLVTNAPIAGPGEQDRLVLVVSALGGEVSRRAEDSTAVPRGNGSPFAFEAVTMNEYNDDTWLGYMREIVEPRLQRYCAPGTYLNLYSEPADGQEGIKWAYGPEKYQRLVALKDRWDPGNVLRFNKNIAPSK